MGSTFEDRLNLRPFDTSHYNPEFFVNKDAKCVAYGIESKGLAAKLESAGIVYLKTELKVGVNSKNSDDVAHDKICADRPQALYIVPVQPRFKTPRAFFDEYMSYYMKTRDGGLRVNGTSKYSLGTDIYSLGTSKHSLGTSAFSLGTDAFSLGTDAHSLGTSKYSLGTAKKPGPKGPTSARKTTEQWMIHIRKVIGAEQIERAFANKTQTRLNTMLRANGAPGVNLSNYKRIQERFGLGQ